MRKKKQKNNNLIIFMLCVIIILCGIGIVKYGNFNLSENKEIEKEEKNNDNKNEEEKEIEKDEYYEYKKLSYYKDKNKERYLKYKEKHNDYSYEQVVTYVNIGLDQEFYSYADNADMDKEILVLMNKYHKLEDYYEPDDLEEINSKYFISGNTLVRKLRKEAKEAFETLSQDSIDNGTPVYGQSAYRPFEMQDSLYRDAVASLGQKQADIDTARPGFSEHQTGLAIDVSSTKWGNMLSFDDTDSFSWMQDNAYKYGFILRYPDDLTDITGFMYESWHYRYVGVKVATDMHNNYPNLTYDEYYVRFIED